MNNKAITILIVAIVAFAGGYFLNSALSGDRIQSESRVNLNNEWDSLSYFIGLSLGYQTADLFEDLEPALIGSGLNTVLNDSSKYDEEMASMIAMQLQNAVMNNKAAEGVKFLEENGRRQGVFTSESGLQYEPIVEGDGPAPTDTSRVEVHYTGTFINGKVFDSSVERGEPATFFVNQVIKGWTEGLKLMSVGSKYKFYIPSDLAYGPRGNRNIPPNSVLIFEVELLSIVE